jgi:hypothetical protein
MDKTEEYEKLAGECLQMASRATSTRDKGRLLGMAEKWIELAERVRRTARRIRAPETPSPSDDHDDHREA